MTAARYPHIAARIFNAPLLIHPQKLDAIVAGLGPRLLGADLADAPEPAAPGLFSTRRGARAERGYRVVDGVAVLSVEGALVHRSRMSADSSFLLGYNDLAADVEDAMANDDVHAILQVYESPGGEANGAFEFAQRMFDLRGKKPMVAIADGMAASAAYLAGSAADQLAVTATGYAGSIGVVARHVDFSRALANDGVAVTHIFAGAHKVDGNPYEPLPEAVRRQWQADIDGLYGEFVAAVARHRGIDAAAVRATQAQTYRGADAVAHRLADRVATTDQLIAELAAQRTRTYPAGPNVVRSTTADTGANMSGTSPAGAQAPAASTPTPAAGFTQADLDRARTEGTQQGMQQGAQAERDRVQAIFGLPAAAAQPALAQQCVATGLTADQASAILGAAPAAAPAAAAPAPAVAATPANPFAAAMASLGNPAVSGLEAATVDDQAAQLAAQVIASHRATR